MVCGVCLRVLCVVSVLCVWCCVGVEWVLYGSCAGVVRVLVWFFLCLFVCVCVCCCALLCVLLRLVSCVVCVVRVCFFVCFSMFTFLIV